MSKMNVREAAEILGLNPDDYDRDGWMDLYIVNGGDLPGYVSEQRPKNALYRNAGGEFVEIAEESGVADAGYGMGVNLSLIHI